MANEKIHEYIDSVIPDEPKGTQIWIDTDTGTNQNGYLSKKMNVIVLAEILRTNYRVHIQSGSNQKQVIATANVPQQITLNHLNQPSRIGMVNHQLIFDEGGIYRVSYVCNVMNIGGQHQYFWTWVQLNGVDVPFSTRMMDAHSNQSGSPCINEMLIEIDPNDELSFWMMGSDTNVQIMAEVNQRDMPDSLSISIVIDKA